MQGQAAMAMYQQFEADRDKGSFDTLPELHAVLSGMKVCSQHSPCKENTTSLHLLWMLHQATAFALMVGYLTSVVFLNLVV